MGADLIVYPEAALTAFFPPLVGGIRGGAGQLFRSIDAERRRAATVYYARAARVWLFGCWIEQSDDLLVVGTYPPD